MRYRLFMIAALMLLMGCRTARQFRHIPPATGLKDDGVELRASLASTADSVVVLPMRLDGQVQYFTYRMQQLDDGNYYVFVPKYTRGMPIDRTHGQRPQRPRGERFGDTFFYNIVVYSNGQGIMYPKKGYYQVDMQ